MEPVFLLVENSNYVTLFRTLTSFMQIDISLPFFCLQKNKMGHTYSQLKYNIKTQSINQNKNTNFDPCAIPLYMKVL